MWHKLGKILQSFMKKERAHYAHWRNQKQWSGPNAKLREDKTMGENLGQLFCLTFSVMELHEVSISDAVCG